MKQVMSVVLGLGLSVAAFAEDCNGDCCSDCGVNDPDIASCDHSCCNDCGVSQPSASACCSTGGPGMPIDTNKVGGAYNKEANVHIQCGTDYFITADFLYWEAMQDGMDLVMDHTNQIASFLETSSEQIKFENFSYKPAFKVGVGRTYAYDGWTAYAQYTWYHHTFSTSYSGPSPTPSLDNFLTAQYGDADTHPDGDFAATAYSSKWKLGIDIGDISVQRPSYIGTYLVLTPSLGVRGALIQQRLNGNSDNFDLAFLPSERTGRYKVRSWAVGPRVGLASSWLMGCGFRFIGNGYASLLFTSYTHARVNFTDDTTADVHRKYRGNYNALRAMTELDLGLGWGDYFCDQTYHFDLALTYDFNVFWNQNMMRHLSNQFNRVLVDSPGNLYLHGLTVEARLDF
jgi:hypothetical protein